MAKQQRGSKNAPSAVDASRRRFRCAIYTRKSSDEGLEQSFNSLHAQRDACEAYIASQKHEGWLLSPKAYDDGGRSGGSMERPALEKLLEEIQSGLIDIVVVYKVDRLTRSLADFAKLTELFDAHGASFVSVTQQFNTSTSMGRLTLNVLLSFAQFEREVAGERIHDKITLSKRRGMWMGGLAPLGYDGIDHKLVVNKAEAHTVRFIYMQYLEFASVAALKRSLDAKGIVSKRRHFKDGRIQGGVPISRGALYQILRNRLYRGQIAYRGEVHEGNHVAILEPELWDAVQARLIRQSAKPRLTGSVASDAAQSNASTVTAPLTNLVFDTNGHRMTPTYAVKTGRRYHYYVSAPLLRGERAYDGIRVPAADLERLITQTLQQNLGDEVWIHAQVGQGFDASQTNRLFASAQELAARIASSNTASPQMDVADSKHPLHSITERVVVGKRRITIFLTRSALAEVLCAIDPDLAQSAVTWRHLTAEKEIDSTGSDNRVSGKSESPFRHDAPGTITASEQTITIEIEAHTLRCGKQIKLVVGEIETDRPVINEQLMALVSDARRWFTDLRTGRCTTIAQIASREGRQVSEISRSISLAFLAPDIVEMIVSGRQPIALTLERLRACRPLPLDWSEQCELLLA
jgi:DNA invertase Pin-like site-specific DNA recombinase